MGMRTGRVNRKMKNSRMGNLRIQVVKRILHRRRLMMELRTKWHQPQRLSVANVEVQRPMERQYTLAQQVDLVGNARNMEVRRRRKESQLLHHVQTEGKAHTQRARRRSRDEFVPQKEDASASGLFENTRLSETITLETASKSHEASMCSGFYTFFLSVLVDGFDRHGVYYCLISNWGSRISTEA